MSRYDAPVRFAVGVRSARPTRAAAAALAVIAGLARGGFAQVPEARNLAWYYLSGGVLGAIYVTTVLVTVRELGAGPVVAATIAGQLTAGVVIDQMGVLGVEKEPVTVGKVVGIVLLAAGVYLIVRE